MRLSPSNLGRVETACNAIAKLIDSPAFRRRFTDVRLLWSPEDVEGAREHLPSALLSFMTVQQPNSTDVFAFDFGDEGGERVVVWNDHAVVADWASFEAFVHWLRGDPAAV